MRLRITSNIPLNNTSLLWKGKYEVYHLRGIRNKFLNSFYLKLWFRNRVVPQGVGVTRWRSWLRHCATSRKVAASIPDGVVENFLWYNPSGRTMALGLTQLLTEISTRNISWGGKGGRCAKLTTLPPSCADCLDIWEPQPPGNLRDSTGL